MKDIKWDENGLVPAIVQNPENGSVLMLGWMDSVAVEKTAESGHVHFWSRSRGELWEKGSTSGNFLDFVSMDVDCDGDALLVKARPHGPTCHTGTTTCWGDVSPGDNDILADLWATIASRARDLPDGSYTTSLIKAGPEGAGRKVVEEATEVLLAAKDHSSGLADDRRVAEEAADLVYHLLVLLAERGMRPADVAAVLEERRG